MEDPSLCHSPSQASINNMLNNLFKYPELHIDGDLGAMRSSFVDIECGDGEQAPIAQVLQQFRCENSPMIDNLPATAAGEPTGEMSCDSDQNDGENGKHPTNHETTTCAEKTNSHTTHEPSTHPPPPNQNAITDHQASPLAPNQCENHNNEAPTTSIAPKETLIGEATNDAEALATSTPKETINGEMANEAKVPSEQSSDSHHRDCMHVDIDFQLCDSISRELDDYEAGMLGLPFDFDSQGERAVTNQSNNFEFFLAAKSPLPLKRDLESEKKKKSKAEKRKRKEDKSEKKKNKSKEKKAESESQKSEWKAKKRELKAKKKKIAIVKQGCVSETTNGELKATNNALKTKNGASKTKEGELTIKNGMVKAKNGEQKSENGISSPGKRELNTRIDAAIPKKRDPVVMQNESTTKNGAKEMQKSEPKAKKTIPMTMKTIPKMMMSNSEVEKRESEMEKHDPQSNQVGLENNLVVIDVDESEEDKQLSTTSPTSKRKRRRESQTPEPSKHDSSFHPPDLYSDILYRTASARLRLGRYREALEFCQDTLSEWYAIAEKAIVANEGNLLDMRTTIAGMWCVFSRVILEAGDAIASNPGLLFDSDNTASQDGNDDVASVSRDFANDVRDLLTEFALSVLQGASHCPLARNYAWIAVAHSRIIQISGKSPSRTWEAYGYPFLDDQAFPCIRVAMTLCKNAMSEIHSQPGDGMDPSSVMSEKISLSPFARAVLDDLVGHGIVNAEAKETLLLPQKLNHVVRGDFSFEDEASYDIIAKELELLNHLGDKEIEDKRLSSDDLLVAAAMSTLPPMADMAPAVIRRKPISYASSDDEHQAHSVIYILDSDDESLSNSADEPMPDATNGNPPDAADGPVSGTANGNKQSDMADEDMPDVAGENHSDAADEADTGDDSQSQPPEVVENVNNEHGKEHSTMAKSFDIEYFCRFCRCKSFHDQLAALDHEEICERAPTEKTFDIEFLCRYCPYGSFCDPTSLRLHEKQCKAKWIVAGLPKDASPQESQDDSAPSDNESPPPSPQQNNKANMPQQNNGDNNGEEDSDDDASQDPEDPKEEIHPPPSKPASPSMCFDITYFCEFCGASGFQTEEEVTLHEKECEKNTTIPKFGSASLPGKSSKVSFDPERDCGVATEDLVDVLSYSVELFTVDSTWRDKMVDVFSRSKPFFEGQIGLRCRCCARREQSCPSGSYLFPRTIHELPETMWGLSLLHLDSCKSQLRWEREWHQEYRRKVGLDSITHEEYWVDATSDMGFTNKKTGGICGGTSAPIA